MSKHQKSEATQLVIECGEVTLRDFDRIVFEKYGAVCGIDEAGRGPIAGDVYAAAVILDPKNPIDGINDSKKLSDKKRELLFDEITAKALSYGIGVATVEEIEQTDILSAALLAMKRAYEQLAVSAGIVIVDGDVLPEIDGFVKNLKHGDARSEAVAAASILAKVSRDRYMKKQGEIYPQYGFERHAGYGTKAHYAAIDEHGACPIHRQSFLTKHNKKNG
ncbi:MAG: ribonuclease HII [Oscillospiraceae bacterium]